MHDSKLIHLLKTLTVEEFKNFSKFIASPFFNSNKKFIVLYNYLYRYYPDFSSSKLTKEKIFKKLYPNRKYNYSIVSNFLSDFLTITEEYILNIQFQKDDFYKMVMLNRAYGERKNSYGQFKKHTQAVEKKIKQRPIKDSQYYQDIRNVNHYFYFHPTTNRQVLGSDFLEQMTKHLDLFYAQAKLFYHLEMKSRAYLFDETYHPIFKEDGLIEQQSLFEKESPVCLIYLKLLNLYEVNEDFSTFQETKSLFFQHINDIAQVERSVILLHLLNYCIRWLNKGYPMYGRESFELYKIGLLNDAFIEQNCMSEITFSNIVSVGVKCGEFEWTTAFIHHYKAFLDKEEKEDAIILSLALLEFYQQKYLETIDLLSPHIFQKRLHIIKAKALLIRAYFEQFLKDDSYFELLIAQTYAFEKYIRRVKGISIEILQAYLRFIQFVRQVGNGILDQRLPDAFMVELDSSSGLPCKDWLLQKAKLVQNMYSS